MSFISFLKDSFWLQDMVSSLICRVPAPVHHNIGKIKTLRKAFAYTGLEDIEGDYVEFGVFQGASLVAAINAYHFQSIPYSKKQSSTPCRFIGCDSFEGLRSVPELDGVHALFDDQEILAIPYEKVMKRLKKFSPRVQIHLIKGFYKDTLPQGAFAKIGLKKLRVILIDCDLKSSTIDALKYSAPFWQKGTVLIFDDFFNYRGDETMGECGAFREFCKAHPEFTFREFGTYGFAGQSMIVTNPPDIRSS